MKLILVTQRVDISESHSERRDGLDQRWARFIHETGAIPIPIPNYLRSVDELLKGISPDGIVLTGGNTSCEYGGDAPERDEIDNFLIEYSIKNRIPLIGVCRGMQSINQFFGGTLKPIAGHVNIKHSITGATSRVVNSYHNFGIDFLPQSLKDLATGKDGSVEMLKHVALPILGCMWHPEREYPFHSEDVSMFENLWRQGEVLA